MTDIALIEAMARAIHRSDMHKTVDDELIADDWRVWKDDYLANATAALAAYRAHVGEG